MRLAAKRTDKKGFSLLVALLLVLLGVTLAAASGGGEHHADGGVLLKDFLWRCLDFGVLAALLYYFMAKPLRKGMSDRTTKLEKALADARKDKIDAEAKFAEYEEKLTQASAEIDEVYAEIRREAEAEKARITANAQAMVDKIKSDTEKAANSQINKARTELRQEASRMAVEIAENLLKDNITDADQARLVDEYMNKVGEIK